MKPPSAYDPDSLLTGEEVAKGLDYNNSSRVPITPNIGTRIKAGELAVHRIPVFMPRVRKANS